MDSPPSSANPSPRRRWRRWRLAIGAALAVMLGGIAAVAYRSFVLPMRKLADVTWLQQATRMEKLDMAHRVLSIPWGGHHDAFLYVAEFGGPESVPILIRALKWQEHTAAGETMDCEKGHCLSALERITGHKAGVNHEDWRKWWDSVGHQAPAIISRPTSRPIQGA